jgi:prepilin-type N-terminal cleavage/methylation domain-containing protein
MKSPQIHEQNRKICLQLRRRYWYSAAPRGMTLIELMIAIAIASTLAVVGYRALASLTTSAQTLTATTQQWQALDAQANAIEHAYRRAAPGAVFSMSATSLALQRVNDAGSVETVAFGGRSETVTGWQFAAWDGSAWVEAWNEARTPLGLRVRLATAQGDLVERVYAR